MPGAKGKAKMALNDQSGLKEQLERLRTQRASLAKFGLHAFRAKDLDELLHTASQLVSDALDIDLVKVLEHLPGQQEMLMRSGVHWEPGVVGHERFGDDENSPGGYALRRDEPVISLDTDAERRFAIPDVLVRHGVKSMVNVVIVGEEEPFGVLEVDARNRRAFNEDDIAFLQNYANLLAGAIERIRATQKLTAAANEQNILARELSHRVQNVLSVVQALASQTSVEGRNGLEYRHAFIGRLRALAAAENLIFEDRDDTLDLRNLIEAVLEPHAADRPDTIEVDGEPARLSARSARMLGLALHELATNASKYGALSVPDGRVSLRWTLQSRPDGQHATLIWRETDGPPVRPPERRGFGTRLLERIVTQELDGTAELSHPKEGLAYQLEFPIEAPARPSAADHPAQQGAGRSGAGQSDAE